MRSVLKFFRSVGQRGFTQLKVLVLAFLMVGMIGATIDLGTSSAGADTVTPQSRLSAILSDLSLIPTRTRDQNPIPNPTPVPTPRTTPTPAPVPTPPRTPRPSPPLEPINPYYALTTEIMTNPKIDLWCYRSETTGDYPYTDINLASMGLPGTNGVMVDIRVLEAIAQAGRTSSGRVCPSSIQNHGMGHSTGSAHYKGIAVDFSIYNGQKLGGRDAASKALMQSLANDPMLQWPQITGQIGRFGQKYCSGGSPAINGWYQYDDVCSHLHVDFCYIASPTNQCTYEPVVPWTKWPSAQTLTLQKILR